MRVIAHPYRPNGLRAVDSSGNVPCWCGHPEGAHVSPAPEPSESEAIWPDCES